MMPLDKQAHILVGAIVVLMLGYVLPAWIGFLVSVSLGAAKEIYDRFHPLKHTCDPADFFATCAGGLVGFIFVSGITK